MTENIPVKPKMTQEEYAQEIVERFNRELDRVRREYEQQGWTTVDFSPLYDPLSKLDTYRAKGEVLTVNGCVKLGANCGCQAEVDKNGSYIPVFTCDLHPNGFASIKTPVAEKKEKSSKPPKEALVCWDHPEHKMVKDQRSGGWTCPLQIGR